MFIGFNSVLYDCRIGDGAAVRFNAVVEGVEIPAGSQVPSTVRVCPQADLAVLLAAGPDATAFSEDVARTNIDLVAGYRAIRNRL